MTVLTIRRSTKWYQQCNATRWHKMHHEMWVCKFYFIFCQICEVGRGKMPLHVVLKQNLRKNCFRWLFPTLTFRLSDSGYRCINRTSRTGIVITQPVADHGWTQAYCWLTLLNAARHVVIYTDIPAAAPYITYFTQLLGVKIALDYQTNTTTACMRG